ncbi:response regulator transcription factor [Anaeromyxobacter paludicola]|uniref:DNA-binding response regulator n=1 Tax=Anaeromyxobacter paludicola TaxID=2918171 RepID=A0ABN6NA84_9BACT|nr:response regulator transcription factor [Anaeromyxobacter paludicola]BDG10157.1 DNA-binding response regulator [Anaeromyxobacter paludicola]
MSEKILVVEDDPSILRGLQLNLGMEGYAVRSAMDGETGLALARTERPDLILLDVGLPRLSGLDFIRALRAEDPDVPILVVSAKGQETDKVTGLSLGADDYVVKPFALKELLARIGAALRRRRSRGETGPRRNVKKAGVIVLDLDARRATVEGREVELTSREYDLLAFFVSHPGRVHSREQLIQAVWGHGYSGTGRTVDNFVVRLRQHIGDDAEHPRHLETVRGLGYRFTP